MRLLVFGGQGWIGTYLLNYLNHHEIIHSQIHINNWTNEKTLQTEIDTVKPDYVLCFIGRTANSTFSKDTSQCTIDYLEDKLDLNLRDNLLAPLLLALTCVKNQIKIMYMGTGCIFETLQEEKFDDNALPNFFGSQYSQIKGITDQLMHHSLLDQYVLNVRIRMPIVEYPHPKNFVTKITQYSKVIDIPNSMTILPDLVPIMIKLIETGTTGTFNLTNPGVISHGDILDLYQQHVDPYFTWTRFSLEELRAITKSGRSNNALETSKLEKFVQDYQLDCPHIKVGMVNLLKKYAQNSKSL